MHKGLKILVPVDFSELSEAAFFAAVDMAKNLRGRLIVLHVLDAMVEIPFFMEGALPVSRIERVDLRIAREKDMAKLLHDERVRELSVRPVFAVGFPHREILERARQYGVDLIVMSTHGRTGLGHFILGSVAEQVVRKAPCPVLTLNPTFLVAHREGKTVPEGALA